MSSLCAQLSLLSVVLSASAVRAEPGLIAYVYFGESDPSGADRGFLALARRRGALALQEIPGRLGDDSSRERIAHAISGYQALQFADAINELDAVERVVIASGGGGLTQGELVDLYAYRAAAQMASDHEAAAWDDLLVFATLAPSRPLDPARFPPRLIEAARRAAPAEAKLARMTVVPEPDDGVVVVDGQLVGRGRTTLALPVGPHLVRVERAGFHATGQRVPLAADAELVFALKPLAPPVTAEIARRGRAAQVAEVLAAYMIAEDGHASLHFERVEVSGARRLAAVTLSDTTHLTASDLAGAVDALLGASGPSRQAVASRRPWFKRPLLWGLAGGAAAVALGVGLGLGLGLSSSGGPALHLSLGSAR